MPSEASGKAWLMSQCRMKEIIPVAVQTTVDGNRSPGLEMCVATMTVPARFANDLFGSLSNNSAKPRLKLLLDSTRNICHTNLRRPWTFPEAQTDHRSEKWRQKLLCE
nr:hypothetical protein CFP56_44332 [Quercus suber]